MGVFHHHDDLKPHNDCQICTIQSTVEDADLPQDNFYLAKIDNQAEAILAPLSTKEQEKLISTLQARAPPKIS